MANRGVVCVAIMAALLAACANQGNATITDKPTSEEMRGALKELLASHPDIAIPEFQLSVDKSPAVRDKGYIRIGSFDCDPNELTFQAAFSAPNLTMQEVEGRFERDARARWRAVVVRSAVVTARDTSRRADWYGDGNFSWSKPENQ